MKTQVILKGTKLSNPRTHTVVEVARKWLIGTRKTSYVVPQGTVRHLEPFGGEPLDITLVGATEPVWLYPKYRIVRVTNSTVLAEFLHERYDDQIQHLREVLDGILKSELGLTPRGERLAALAGYGVHESGVGFADDATEVGVIAATEDTPTALAAQFVAKVEAETGLKIHYRLDQDKATRDWFTKLLHSLSHDYTATFQPHTQRGIFQLHYALKFKMPALTHSFSLLGRSGAALSPSEESSKVAARIETLLQRPITAMSRAALSCTIDRFWTAVEHELAPAVEATIRSEFGYDVTFGNLRPGQDEFVREFDERDRKNNTHFRDVAHLENRLKEAQLALEATEKKNFDHENPDFVRIAKVVKSLTGELETARSTAAISGQVGPVRPTPDEHDPAYYAKLRDTVAGVALCLDRKPDLKRINELRLRPPKRAKSLGSGDGKTADDEGS